MSQLATPPYVLQANTVSHGAQLFREALASLVSPAGGIVSPGDLGVTQNGTPNMTVNVAPGQVWIPGSQAGSLPSGYPVQAAYYSQATASTSLAIAAANATNPRVDQIIAQVQDAAYAGATNSCQLAVLTGTPTAGASLANLVGLGTFPPTSSSALLVAYVLVPANATTIVTADIANVATIASRATGAWQAITPGTNIGSVAGLYTAQVRLVGDMVAMRGGLKNNTGGSATAFGTIPAGFRPASTVLMGLAASGGTTAVGQIDTSGNLTTTIGIANGSSIVFDGLAYSLA